MNLGDESKQTRERKRFSVCDDQPDKTYKKRGKYEPRLNKTVGRVVENDYLVEMEAEGQSDEFLSEVEEETQDSGKLRSGKVCIKENTKSGEVKDKQRVPFEIEGEPEIVLRIQSNNNANIILGQGDEDQSYLEKDGDESVEEGECTEDQE